MPGPRKAVYGEPAAHYGILHAMSDDLNDAFQTYYPPRRGARRWAFRALSACLAAGERARRAGFGGRLLVNERIVEYPLVFRWLRPAGRVLDIGCVSSRLPVQLACLGYEVHGLDVRPYPYSHPNLRFHQSDVMTWEPAAPFDSVLLVSTIEHFGLGGYGDPAAADADRLAVERIRGWLAPGGQLLVSVPFGQPAVTYKHRIYDPAQLAALFADFRWVEARYFARLDGAWQPSTEAQAARLASPGMPVNGVAVLNLERA